MPPFLTHASRSQHKVWKGRITRALVVLFTVYPNSSAVFNFLLRHAVVEYAMRLIRCKIGAIDQYHLVVTPFALLRSIKLTIVPKSIPLRATLSIQYKDIIINDTGRLMVNALFERLSAVEWLVQMVQLPVQREADALFDLLGGSAHNLWREKIEHAQVIVFAEKPPGIALGSGRI